MFVYNILSMETPIELNINGNTFYSNKKEIEQVNKILDKKNKEFNEKFFKEHCISDNPLKNKGKLVVIPNPLLDNHWFERFKTNWKKTEHTALVWGTAGEEDSCNGKDYDFLYIDSALSTDVEIAINTSIKKIEEIKNAYKNTIHKAYPITPDECFAKENWLNNKKHILVITLPSNFISILKILKTNKEQYFTLYKSKWSLKEKTFDAIVVDSSMPYHLEFYNSIKKYIKYKVPTYLLEKETLKTLK